MIADIIEQMHTQEAVDHIRTEHWYRVDATGVNSEVQQLFYPSSIDSETYEFLNNSVSISQNTCLQVIPIRLFHAFLFLAFLHTFYDITSSLCNENHDKRTLRKRENVCIFYRSIGRVSTNRRQMVPR